MESQLIQQEILWGVALWRVALAALLLVLGLLSRPFVRWMVRRVVGVRQFREALWAADAVELLTGPVSLVVHVALWYGVGQLLNLPQEPYDLRLLVMNGLLVAVAVAVAAVLFRLVDVGALAANRWAAGTETRLDDQLVPLLRTTLKVILACLVGIGIADMIGWSITSLIAGLSVGGLALALAAKDTVANLFGSVVIFTDQPFSLGDVVDIAGTEGVVEEVGLRVTRIRQPDKSLATVPNQSFTTTKVVNFSRRTQRRIRFTVGLSYSTTTAQMEAFTASLRSLLQAMEDLDGDSVIVHLASLDDSSLGVLVQVLTTRPEFAAFMATQEAVLMSVLRLAEAQGLDIAFPSRTVYLQQAETGA